jgi:hypothetical protein
MDIWQVKGGSHLAFHTPPTLLPLCSLAQETRLTPPSTTLARTHETFLTSPSVAVAVPVPTGDGRPPGHKPTPAWPARVARASTCPSKSTCGASRLWRSHPPRSGQVGHEPGNTEQLNFVIFPARLLASKRACTHDLLGNLFVRSLALRTVRSRRSRRLPSRRSCGARHGHSQCRPARALPRAKLLRSAALMRASE